MITLNEIAAFLDGCLEAARYAEDTSGVYRASGRAIRRLGLALEADSGLPAWVEAQRLDALFLHRPWKLEDLTDDCGVLACHLSFDEHLTLGYNRRLADALLLADIQVLGVKEGRPLGMIGAVKPQSFAALTATLHAIFGGQDAIVPPHTDADISCVAIVGAMTDALVREAQERGAQMYVTGQFRVPARLAVEETGLGVFVVGHRRSELWGLRALAGLLRERWAELEVVIAPGNEP